MASVRDAQAWRAGQGAHTLTVPLASWLMKEFKKKMETTNYNGLYRDPYTDPARPFWFQELLVWASLRLTALDA